jgi:hypothetical protein
VFAAPGLCPDSKQNVFHFGTALSSRMWPRVPQLGKASAWGAVAVRASQTLGLVFLPMSHLEIISLAAIDAVLV